jgi:predicted dehydrogenase
MGQVKIGVIGAGWWAAEHIVPVLQSHPNAKVVGACRLGKPELEQLRERFKIPFVTENFEELLDQNLNAVVVSSPHNFHYQHAKAALDRGLHVLCEKPMVLHAEQARDLASEAKAKALHFLIPYGWNYMDISIRAKEIIDRGEVGTIEHVHCHMASPHRDLFNGQPTWWAEHSLFQPLASTWSDPATGGGFLHGQLTHTLGLMFYLTDLQPAEVFALTANFDSGADRSNSISCRFTNGATGNFGGTATMPPRSTYQIDIRIFGSEGMLLLDVERPRLELRRKNETGETIALKMSPGEYTCVEPYNTWIGLIRGESRENRSSGAVGVRVVEVLDAAVRSAKSRSLEAV